MSDRNLFRDAPFLSRIWRLFPTGIRLALYRLIWRNDRLFPSTRSRRVRRPFPGIYLKHGVIRPTEAHAMALIRRHTNLSTSVVLDYIQYVEQPHGAMLFPITYGYLLMTEAPGTPLQDVADTLTSDQIVTIARDLRNYLDALRTIPNPFEDGICSSAGGSMEALRFTMRDRDIPPAKDTNDFHGWIQRTAKEGWSFLKPYVTSLFTKYAGETGVFTHGDLSADNIMIHEGRFAGLIDWETSGWLPRYWESSNARWDHFPVCKRIVNLALPEHDHEERYSIRMAGAVTSQIPVEYCRNLEVD